MRRLIITGLVAFAVLALAQGYASADLISGVSTYATAEMTNREGWHTVDGSGLNINGPGTHSSDPEGTMWLSSVSYNYPYGAQPSIRFDLPAAYDLTSLKVWNYNEASIYMNGRGVATMNIQVSSDNAGTWTDLGSFSVTKAPGDGSTTGKDYLAFGDVLPLSASNVTNVWFMNLIPHDTGLGGKYVGLSEVQIFGTATVPEPSSIALLIAAALGLACYAWRRTRR